MCSHQGTTDLRTALEALGYEPADVLDEPKRARIAEHICKEAGRGGRSATPGIQALDDMAIEQGLVRDLRGRSAVTPGHELAVA